VAKQAACAIVTVHTGFAGARERQALTDRPVLGDFTPTVKTFGIVTALTSGRHKGFDETIATGNSRKVVRDVEGVAACIFDGRNARIDPAWQKPRTPLLFRRPRPRKLAVKTTCGFRSTRLDTGPGPVVVRQLL